MPDQKSNFECFAKLNNSIYALGGADRENFASLLNIAYQFPKGQETMNAVAFQGYTYMYQAMFGVNGACDYDRKVVRLDSYRRQMELAPILIHECTHIRQVERLNKVSGQDKTTDFIGSLNAYDFIKLNRALEADACAHQAAFAYQMKEEYPQVFEKEMETPMMRAYVGEMEKSGDETKAMQASFQAWYGYKNYQEAYEKQYVAQIRMNSEQKKKDLNPAKKEAALSNEQLASVCLHNGQPYISAAFFDRAENMAVSDKGKEMMAQTGDKSVAKLPVRNEQKQKTPSPILLKAAAAIRGR